MANGWEGLTWYFTEQLKINANSRVCSRQKNQFKPPPGKVLYELTCYKN